MPGKSDNLLVGLSIGTSKTTMIVAERDARYPDGVHVIGFGNSTSRGINKGVISNHTAARQSVEKAYQDARSITGISQSRLRDVVVAFNAMDVQTFLTNGLITLGGIDSKPVEASELERVIEIARSNVALPNNMYPLHMIPVRYTINGDIVEEPLNMSGSRLEIDMQTIAVPRVHVENIRRCVEKAGLKVKGLILKPLASSLGALTQDEMSAGCISICIGGGTTGIVLYESGRAIDVISIPIGGDHITSDLSAIMQLSLHEAEHLKRRIFDPRFTDEILAREGYNIDLASDVILSRIEELFIDYIQVELNKYNPQLFPAGVILSGGVSFMSGLDRILADILHMPVRRADEPIYSMPPNLDNAAFVSPAGILRYMSAIEADPYLFMSPDRPLPGTLANKQGKEKERDRDNEPEPGDDYPEGESYSGTNGDYNTNNRYVDEPYGNGYGGDEGEGGEDEPPRRRIGDFFKGLAERFQDLF